ncbi:uncharacterized protein BXZ73DRAFT_82536 [Epithele typhae]|uniref:uncharacterized protein n=1 Tax=Epithele typhae TaxID=378194 RepID=UPI0020081FD4|nr:uncharacterized protein BXZ73DRAFT_82536 [Epithele typhae]KAH9912069.1 hypothetical protein BXZ73DRAFT_82536 [Epithele typhae]
MPISSSIRLPRFAPSAAHLSTQSRAPSAAFLLRPHGLPPSGELRCAGDVHSEIRVLVCTHHVPAKIVSKARRELVVIEEVECEHLGGFDIHGFPELPRECMVQAPQTHPRLDFDASGSTLPYAHPPLAQPKGVRLSLTHLPQAFSIPAPDARPSGLAVPQADARHDPDGLARASLALGRQTIQLVRGVLDRTGSAAGVALMYADRRACRRARSLLPRRSSPSLATTLQRSDAPTLVDFDSDTRPRFRTVADGPGRRRRYSSSRVAHTPASAPCREVLGDEAGGVERHQLQHCGAGTAFERVSGTDTDVDVEVKPATLTDPTLVHLQLGAPEWKRTKAIANAHCSPVPVPGTDAVADTPVGLRVRRSGA